MEKFYDVKLERRVAVVTVLNAELYLAQTDDIKKGLWKLIGEGRHLIFDMSKVFFISSSFLVVLVSCLKQASGEGRKIALFGVNDNVNRVLTTTGMREIIPICDTEKEAVNTVLAR